MFYFRTTYRDKPNRDVTDVLIKEVRAHNPTFSAADIRGVLNISVHQYWGATVREIARNCGVITRK